MCRSHPEDPARGRGKEAVTPVYMPRVLSLAAFSLASLRPTKMRSEAMTPIPSFQGPDGKLRFPVRSGLRPPPVPELEHWVLDAHP